MNNFLSIFLETTSIIKQILKFQGRKTMNHVLNFFRFFTIVRLLWLILKKIINVIKNMSFEKQYYIFYQIITVKIFTGKNSN